MAIALGGNQINKAYLGTTEIQKMYLGGDLVFDNSIQPSELTPIMTNFRVNEATPTHVHFDTPLGQITGLTTDGFVISGKNILSVDSTLNYFTVDTPFTFWDNNTIRLGENTDTSDVNPSLHNFTLSYIENNIPEPTNDVADYRYVTTAATGGGDGESEGTAWTWTEADGLATAGMTVWVKAGNYGNIDVLLNKVGTDSDPIKFVGYKDTIGDITSNYLNKTGDNWSTAEMPTIDAGDLNSGYQMMLIYEGGTRYILRNLQITNGQDGIIIGSSGAQSGYCILDRFNVKTIGDTNEASPIKIGSTAKTGMSNMRVTNCVIIDGSLSNISYKGEGNSLFYNNSLYNSRTSSTHRADYMFNVNGSNNILKDNLAEYGAGNGGSTHGIGIRGDGVDTPNDYNLIVGNTATNIQESLYVRNDADHNVIKGNTVLNNGNTSSLDVGAFCIWSDSDYNIFENNYTKDQQFVYYIYDNAEDGGTGTEIGTNNIFRNNIHDAGTYGEHLIYGASNQAATFTDNYAYNNTFVNYPNFFHNHNTATTINNFVFKNNIFETIGGGGGQVGCVFDYNTFWNSWTTSIGANDINENPNLTDYVPDNEALYVDGYPNLYYDLNKKERTKPKSTIGAITLVSEQAGTEPPVTDIDYYVSFTDGLDTNPGTEAEPWKTLSKVETEITSADAGKVIAFKKGDEWNAMLNLTDVKGTLGNEITFTSYGTGAKPIINNKTVSTFTWSNVSGSIWKTTLADAPQRLIVDGTERLGGANIEYAQLGDLVPDRVEWWHGSGELYFWSATSPNALEFEYSTAAQGRSLYLLGSDYIVFDGIDLRGGDVTSVTIYGSENIEFKNNEIGIMSNSGIRALYSSSLTRHCANISIHDNNFDTKFDFDYSQLGTYASAENTGADDGVYIRSLKVGSVYNNTFRNWGHAEISISPQGTEGAGYVAHDINVYENTFTMTIAYGRGFGMSGNAYNVDVYNNQFITCPTPIQFNGYNNNFYGNTLTGSYQTPLKLWRQSAMSLQGYGINSHTNIIEDNDFIDCTQPAFGIDGNNYSCNVEDNIFRNNNISNCGGANSGLSIDLLPTESAGFEAINNTFTGNNIYSSLSSSTINDNGTMRTVATWNGTTTVGNTVSGNTANLDGTSELEIPTGIILTNK